MDILLIDAILFFADYENLNIAEINSIDQDNKIAYFTLKDGKLIHVYYGDDKLDFYFDEEI